MGAIFLNLTAAKVIFFLHLDYQIVTKLNKMSNLARMVNCSRSVVMARWQKPVFPSALALTKFAAGGAMFTAFMNGFKTPMPGSETGEWAAPLFGYLLIFWIPIYYTLGLIV